MDNVMIRNNVRVVGNGDQALIFAHGFGCDQNVWRHFIKAFQSDFKCILFDYVGSGQSDIQSYTSSKYDSLQGYAQDILDICEELNLTNAIFIGHSVSCMTGVYAALSKPEYFSRLVFVCPSPCYINEDGYTGGMDKADLIDLLAMMDTNYLGWSSTIAPMVMGNPERPELGDELTANFCATDPKIAGEFARVTFLSDSRDALAKLKVPSLTLQCTNDMLAPESVGRYINENTAGNIFMILDATGHCPHLSAPQAVIGAVRSYVEEAMLVLG